jgi:hypothetical protein
MSQKTDKLSKSVISKAHIIEKIGRDSPGVGTYNYDYGKLSKSILATNGNGGGKDYSFGFGTRFFDFRQNYLMKTSM